MKLRFTPEGRRQYLLTLAEILDRNPGAALAFHARVARALARLERFPDSGRRLPEFADLPHREVIVRPYRFFYRTEGRIVWVVAVWHGARVPRRPPR